MTLMLLSENMPRFLFKHVETNNRGCPQNGMICWFGVIHYDVVTGLVLITCQSPKPDLTNVSKFDGVAVPIVYPSKSRIEVACWLDNTMKEWSNEQMNEWSRIELKEFCHS